MAVQWTIAVILIISSGICIFFAIDFRKIGQITKRIMSTTDSVTNMTYIYFNTNETWKGLTQMRFKGMLGTYAKFILDPRALIAAKVDNGGDQGTGLKPAFWFCSANDFKRIYNNFVDAVEKVDTSKKWRLPAENPEYARSCVQIKFKQLKNQPENICWLQMHSSGRDDETDKKNLAIYVPLVMGIGFACLAIVCIVWAT